MTQMGSILRSVTRKQGEPLNILTGPTHERYETGLAKANAVFYGYRAEHIKGWNTQYAPVPDNYILLDDRYGETALPLDVEFDLVLSQHKFGQFQKFYPIAKFLGIPLVSLEHTLPAPDWDEHKRKVLAGMKGDINVFISDYSIDKWGFEKTDDVRVIKHCVDSELFNPRLDYRSDVKRENRILSVVNDWVGRDWCCGFQNWQRVTQGLPVFPVGDTQGLSRPASSTDELVDFYAQSRIFINTSIISPVPTALLEAMSCGCAVVSTSNCMIPEVIEHGVNGFMTNDEDEMRGFLELLMRDEELAFQMGQAARETIVRDFSVERFTNEWNDIFNEVIK